jgi:hypothetical protein
MTIKKPARKAASALASEQDIERIISGGSPPVSDTEAMAPEAPPEIKFQMVVPGELCRQIDDARRPTKTSRRVWLLQAAQEKLQREGKL